ncbi:hypothetical protein MTR62_15720 [Novosphingobium sp. 1949]|uniref:Uncharacterized protein n=1 Tax=Novosphingobium organovorum TaxID=2930092 RepID=A0ABT0BH18_9SPHN|nr:hypothetical protein [Novosphingobium organovorum]MCJ2184128.1 hypothetical protein [Novosphingobium organovorum]
MLPLAALALLLAGCGKADSDPGPGGVTMGEARALDRAAAMLDARRPPAAALEPSGQRLAPQDASAPEATAAAVRSPTVR